MESKTRNQYENICGENCEPQIIFQALPNCVCCEVELPFLSTPSPFVQYSNLIILLDTYIHRDRGRIIIVNRVIGVSGWRERCVLWAFLRLIWGIRLSLSASRESTWQRLVWISPLRFFILLLLLPPVVQGRWRRRRSWVSWEREDLVDSMKTVTRMLNL